MTDLSLRRTVISKAVLAVAVLISLAAGLGLTTPAAEAQASRTWVSGVGDDANPCSRTAPCKTFAGAISKTAANGEINVLDSGGYGAVTITKSITIDGGGALASILAAGTNGIVVNAAATDKVTIRNISINGFKTGLNGIRFLAGGSLHVENVEIFRFSQKAIEFTPSGNSALFVRNSRFTENSAAAGGGIFIKPGAGANVVGSVIDTMLDRNQFGIRMEDRVTLSVVRTAATNNLAQGFFVVAGAAASLMPLNNCVASGNAAGVRANNAVSTIHLSNSTVTGNTSGLIVTGGSIISFGNNQVLGNIADGVPTGTALEI